MKSVYGALVALHPPSFRRQFGPEMEWIFDESGHPTRLIADALLSLARQWLLRTQAWLFILAAFGGLIPFALGFGVIRLAGGTLGVQPLPHRHMPHPVHLVSEPASQPFIMLTTMIAVLFISGTMIFAITWFRHCQQMRRRRA